MSFEPKVVVMGWGWPNSKSISPLLRGFVKMAREAGLEAMKFLVSE